MRHCVVLAGRDQSAFLAARGPAWWDGLAGAGGMGGHAECTLLLAGGPREAGVRLSDAGFRVARLADAASYSTFPQSGSVADSFLAYQWIKDQQFTRVDFPFAGGLAHHSVCAKRQGLAFADTPLRVHLEALPDVSAPVDIAGGGVEWLATEYMQEASLAGCDKAVGHSPATVAWLQGIRSSQAGNALDSGAGGMAAGSEAAAASLGAAEGRFGGKPPLVSVCLVHHERPALLTHAVGSLAEQDYPNYEVILVDDGSREAESLAYLRQLEPFFAARGWKIVRQDNRYLGAARNHAARVAGGEFLLFMDDDNVARSDELSVLVGVAERTSADIVTCTPGVFHGDGPAPGRCGAVWIPYGPTPAIGLVVNGFGDANALVRRNCFDVLGGFTEDYGVGHEDWEFLAKAALRGLRIELVPEPLFSYRVRESGMLRSGQCARNLARNIRPYLERYPELGTAHRLLQALFEHTRSAARAEPPEIKVLRATLEQTQGSLAALRQELDAVLASRSWRLTAPLRRLVDALRRHG